jgi:hypothetical protein
VREIKITDLITKSVDRTGLMLFKPFSAKKWLKLLLIAFLAGALPGGGLGGGGGRDSEKKAQASPSIVQTQTVSNESASPEPVLAADNSKKDKDKADQMIEAVVAKVMSLPPAIMTAVIFGAVLLFLIVIVLFLWLGARFRFVWLNAVMGNRDAVREPFHRYKKEGDSLFKLWLAVGAGSLLFIGILIGWVVAVLVSVNFFKGGEAVETGSAIVSLIVAFVIFFAGMIVLSVWSVVVDHFVTVIMATDRITFRPAWQKFWRIYQQNAKDLWLYLLVAIGLGIVVGIAQGVLFFLALIVFLLAGFLVFGLLYLIFALVQAKMLFWSVAFVLAVPAGLAALAVLGATGLPFAVFFRNFSLYYLTSLNCGYAPLMLSNPKAAA